jgi:hypothetical protein
MFDVAVAVAFCTAGLRPAFLNSLRFASTKGRGKTKAKAPAGGQRYKSQHRDSQPQFDSDPFPVFQPRLRGILRNVSNDTVELLLTADEMIIILALPESSCAAK